MTRARQLRYQMERGWHKDRRSQNRRFGRIIKAHTSICSRRQRVGAPQIVARPATGDKQFPEEKRCPACLGMEQLGLQATRGLAGEKAILSVGIIPASALPMAGSLGKLGCWWDFGDGGPALSLYPERHRFRGRSRRRLSLDAGHRPRLEEAEQDGSKTQRDSRRLPRINRLGVLRMDVDDLGSLFVSGFKSHCIRLASLSSDLRLFFEDGSIGWLWRWKAILK